jgi:acyl-CoA thioester hydrolase
MFCSETSIRVRYGETDKMGYLYYGHYPEYFEVSRTDMIRLFGLTYREIEENGIIMPVRSLKVDYKSPAFYDELLTVKSCLNVLPVVKLDIDYEIWNAKKQLICTGNTVLAFVDAATGKPRRAPEFFIEAVAKYFKT